MFVRLFHVNTGRTVRTASALKLIAMATMASIVVTAQQQGAVQPQLGGKSGVDAPKNDTAMAPNRRQRTPRPPRPGIFTSLDSAKTMPDSVLYLNLRGKGLGSITGLSAFKNLVAIDLSGNNLTSFPMDVIKLGKLTSIDLSDNPIKTVPAEIGTLASLSRLNLRNTGITTLPAQIGNCSSLAALDVSKNPLASLPIKELNHMPKLRGITLGRPETEGGAAPVPANAPVSPKK
jgi:Leucine-rich repeat (LRR) protein